MPLWKKAPLKVFCILSVIAIVVSYWVFTDEQKGILGNAIESPEVAPEEIPSGEGDSVALERVVGEGVFERLDGQVLDRRVSRDSDGGELEVRLVAVRGSGGALRVSRRLARGEGSEWVERWARAEAADCLLLKLGDGVSRRDLQVRLSVMDRRFRLQDLGNGWARCGFRVENLDELDRMRRLLRTELLGEVEAIEADLVLFASVLESNDPSFVDGSQWGLSNGGESGGTLDADIDGPEAWELRNDASDVVVAVLDTGIRYTHEDLASNMWVNEAEVAGDGLDNDGNGVVDDVYGYNAIKKGGNPFDDGIHGSHVAGTIGAVGNNGVGVSGVAWRTRLMAVKGLSGQGWGLSSDLADGVDYAVENGADVVNNSYGGSGFSQILYDAFERASEAGVLMVVAAGNESADNDTVANYPADFDLDTVVVVGSSNEEDKVSPFSNYGKFTVDLLAPGSNILSTSSESDSAYKVLSGTSMAAPHVAGALALLKAEYSEESVEELIRRLLASVDRMEGFAGKARTAGRLNLFQALSGSVNGGLPRFGSDLESVVKRRGERHTLEASVEDGEGISYQWYRNGVAIAGATGTSYTIEGLSSATEGEYFVVASNAYGVTRSKVVRVELPEPARIVSQPTSASGREGKLVRFQVEAEGTPNLEYQWYRDGMLLDGETAAELERVMLDADEEVGFFVRVSNEFGSDQSDTVYLRINESPRYEYWKGVYPDPMSSNLYGLTYGDGQFVAVGSSGQCFVSLDGVSWERHYVRSEAILAAVDYVDGRFVTCGNGGVIFVSDDGCRWTRMNSGVGDNLRGVAGRDGQLLVVGHGVVSYLNEGSEEWVVVDHASWLSDVMYTGSEYVAVSLDGEISISADGASWETVDVGEMSFYAIEKAFDRLYAFGSESGEAVVYRSDEGGNWEKVGFAFPGADLYGASFDGETIVAAGSNGLIIRSDDGENWESTLLRDGFQGVAIGNGRYVVVGVAGLVSSTLDASRWPFGRIESTTPMEWVEETAHGYFASGGDIAYVRDGWTDYSAFYWSQDGKSWEGLMLPVNERVVGMVDRGDGLLAVSDGGSVLESSDGVDWRVVSQSESFEWVDLVELDGDIFAIASDGSDVSGFYRLNDTTNDWDTLSMASVGDRYECLYTDGERVYIGGQSADGAYAIWRMADEELTVVLGNGSGIDKPITSIVSGGGAYCAIGAQGDYFISKDGVNWDYQYMEESGLSKTVAFFNGLFIWPGREGTIHVSENGKNWTEVIAPAGGEIFDLGGSERLVAVGRNQGGFEYTDNGYEWKRREMQTRYHGFDILDSGDGMLGVVNGGVLLYSESGEKWLSKSIPGLTQSYSIAMGAGRFAVPGIDELGRIVIAVSDNSSDWILSEHFEGGALYEIEFLKGRLVGVGSQMCVVSDDGIKWESRLPEVLDNVLLFDLEANEELIVAVGERVDATTRLPVSRVILSSEDGLEWVVRSEVPSELDGYRSVAYGNGVFVASGSRGATAWSEDGLNWEQRQLPSSSSLPYVGFGEGVFLAMGGNGTAAYSEDGSTWSAIDVNVKDFFASAVRYEAGTFWMTGDWGAVYRLEDEGKLLPPNAVDITVALSASNRKVPLDVLSFLGDGIDRADVEIRWIGLPTPGGSEIAYEAYDCDNEKMKIVYQAGDYTRGVRDRFEYSLEREIGIGGEMGEVTVEYLDPIELSEEVEVFAHVGWGLLILDLPLREGNKIVSIESGDTTVGAQALGDVLTLDLSDRKGRLGDLEVRVCFEDEEALLDGGLGREIKLKVVFSESRLLARGDVFRVSPDRPTDLYPLLNDYFIDSELISIVEVGDRPAGARIDVMENGTRGDARDDYLRFTPVSVAEEIVEFEYCLEARVGEVSNAKIVLIVGDGDEYQAWRSFYFDSFTSESGAKDADPLATGLSNLVKYQLGLDPSDPSVGRGSLLHYRFDEQALEISLQSVPNSALGLEYLGRDGAWVGDVLSIDGAEIVAEEDLYSPHLVRGIVYRIPFDAIDEVLLVRLRAFLE